MAAFRGRLWFCSNFYPADCWYDGECYPTSEHAFQAAKTLDKSERKAIMEAKTPGESKRLGRRVTLRSDWNDIRVQVMYEILCSKFKDSVLRQALINTGNQELVEVNEWNDTFWGQCPEGVGENNLGKCLMSLREQLQMGVPQAIETIGKEINGH
jgi:hypothetical protein